MTGNRIFAGYLLIAALTFAWSASDPAHECVDDPATGYVCMEAGGRIISGIVAGALWPLYWLWTGAEYLREQQP